MLVTKYIIIKRAIDIVLAIIGLFVFGWLILSLALLVFLLTLENGFFCQERVGQYGKIFRIIKIKTIYKNQHFKLLSDLLRKSKLDELPQLWNVLIGDMSMVGPRPDISGFADELQGRDRIILNIKPGITGPASLYYHNEEQLLNNQQNKEDYNRNVIWKKKIKINLCYIDNFSLKKDFKYMFLTVTQVFKNFLNDSN